MEESREPLAWELSSACESWEVCSPPFAVMLSFRERGDQHHFVHVSLAQHSGAVVNCAFSSKSQERGYEKAFKPPLWSHVLTLIGVCLSPCSRQHLRALKLTSRLPRRPREV